jgi:site-specific DNA-methyltransferase (adenine-specific)|tara:strand:+ start:3039 stop:3896 length:858 start_codon:yes stop_codon:yes gene_type:complete
MSITLHEGCCLEELAKVADKSIQLVCIDPPYNINKDTWDNIDNYVEWLTSVIVLLETKMKNSGSLFVFHNEMETIAELILSIRTKSKLKLKQMITWNKRFNESRQKGYLDGYVVKNDMHMFNKMCEYILFYTFDNHELIRETRKEKNVAQTTISSEVLSKTGGMTGWYSNIETGKNHPTRETMKPITKHLGLEYDDVVPKFKNQKTHHSVWNFDMAKRNKVHITPKPIDLLENIIRHTTDEGDVLLDCFAGSGSLGMAAKNTNRKCILIEREEKYCAFIRSELEL